jgi:pyridoxamine 5'-phosphate oxidase-like protein
VHPITDGIIQTVKEFNMKPTGVLAWHPQVAMSKDEIDEFLSGRWNARLATIGKDGYPHVTPLWYYWDGECMYFALTTKRQSCKNLQHNPRCSAVVDMDDRPLMGMRSNMAKAILLIGDAEMTVVGSDKKVTIGGPWKGEHTPEQAVAMLTQRYGLTERDGAIGFTREKYMGLFAAEESKESQLYKDNLGRVLTKLIPKRIQAWDFSKAPIGYAQ